MYVQEYKLNDPGKQIDWPGNSKPEDEPSCGFDNSKCPKVNAHEQSVVAAGTLGILLFCATVVTASIYRKWKIEQEIEGLLWKIHPSELHSYCGDIASPPSKVLFRIHVKIFLKLKSVGLIFNIYL